MAGSMGDDDDGINEINVTPMVDVMLVLLIIFMVTANYMTSQSIEMKLPKASTGAANEQVQNLGFSIDKDSKLFLDGQPVNYADLTAVLAEKLAAKPDISALISADIKTPHGEVVKLIDFIRKNGITNFAINVEVEE
ncbi:MAG: biopolymer transporter ExbD [Proteobacteria bacterium]|nr:MAG: biopolymer transporter ExbD [Pseudomonadota bacterium]